MTKRKAASARITQRDARALTRADAKQRLDNRSRDEKVELLGQAIAVNMIAKSSFSEDDIRLAGFELEEGKALYGDALTVARQLEPNLDAMALS